jgi:endonuclease/exonuclease/phosphatase (EEP) superfamily protein YafD
MFKAKENPQILRHQSIPLPCKFSLLLWNIHKENQSKKFQAKLTILMQKYPSDILLFQEVKYPKKETFFLEKQSFVLASNMQTSKNIFGVLTAMTFAFEEISISLSTKKELGCISHKSFLISRHTLCNGENLYLVNLHAINFVPFASFKHEMQHIAKILITLEGALIVGGDFNNWNVKRLHFLSFFAKELHLKKLDVENAHHIKHIFNKKIDHIFYRGIQASAAQAIDTGNISDHNPIYAVFES